MLVGMLARTGPAAPWSPGCMSPSSQQGLVLPPRWHRDRASPMLRRGTLPGSRHRSSPSLSWPISSDRQTPALSPSQSPCPAKHTKRIHYPMGDRKEGPGGGSSPHNAHKWRAGPPLLCLGRKGRDPRRGPLNGSIVSDPPVPLGVLLVSPRLHFQPRVWGSADSPPHVSGGFGVPTSHCTPEG